MGALEFVGLGMGDSVLDVRLSRGKVAGGEAALSIWCSDVGNTNLVLQTSVLQYGARSTPHSSPWYRKPSLCSPVTSSFQYQ